MSAGRGDSVQNSKLSGDKIGRRAKQRDCSGRHAKAQPREQLHFSSARCDTGGGGAFLERRDSVTQLCDSGSLLQDGPWGCSIHMHATGTDGHFGRRSSGLGLFYIGMLDMVWTVMQWFLFETHGHIKVPRQHLMDIAIWNTLYRRGHSYEGSYPVGRG